MARRNAGLGNHWKWREKHGKSWETWGVNGKNRRILVRFYWDLCFEYMIGWEYGDKGDYTGWGYLERWKWESWGILVREMNRHQ